MLRRVFLAALSGLAGRLLPRKKAASEREELADPYRKDANGKWRRTGRLDLRPGDEVVVLGLTDGELWMLDRFTVGQAGAYIDADGLESAAVVCGSHSNLLTGLRVFSLAALLALLLSGCDQAARTAPAPFVQGRFAAGEKQRVRPDGRPVLHGEYLFVWHGGKGTCWIDQRGGWRTKWYGHDWIGAWNVQDGVLTVVEAVRPADPKQAPNWTTWKVSLDAGKWQGRTASGGEFQVLLPGKPLP